MSSYNFTSDNRTVTYDTSTASDDESDNEFPNEDSDSTVAPAPTASMNVSNLAQAMTQLKESGTEIKAISFGGYQVPESAKVFDVSGIGSSAILAFVKEGENRLYVTNRLAEHLSLVRETAFLLMKMRHLPTLKTSSIRTLILRR